MKSNYLTKLIVLVCMLALSFTGCKDNNPDNTAPVPTKPPKDVIRYKQAQILEKEFIESRYNFINQVLEYEDTREYWFDLETLKQYIAYVEYEASQKGYENLGIRIYNGAYPKDSNYGDPGYSTVFLVPTGSLKPDDKGSIASFNMLTAKEASDNIQELQPLNFAHGGKPPKQLK